jgi:hypothetical protein
MVIRNTQINRQMIPPLQISPEAFPFLHQEEWGGIEKKKYFRQKVNVFLVPAQLNELLVQGNWSHRHHMQNVCSGKYSVFLLRHNHQWVDTES